MTLIPSNLPPQRDCGTKRDKHRFSTALYRSIYLTLIPSNLSPQRDCGPKRDKYRLITTLYIKHTAQSNSKYLLPTKGTAILNGAKPDTHFPWVKTLTNDVKNVPGTRVRERPRSGEPLPFGTHLPHTRRKVTISPPQGPPEAHQPSSHRAHENSNSNNKNAIAAGIEPTVVGPER